MELFLQKQLDWFREQSDSLRSLFFIFSTLALFCLSMGFPLLGFVYSGLSLILFFAIPTLQKVLPGVKRQNVIIPATIHKYNELENLQPQIDWLAEGHHFSQLREYLEMLKNAQSNADDALQEIHQLSSFTINQLEAEIFLMQAYSRLTSLDALELGLLNIKKSTTENVLQKLGRHFKNNGHWRFASEVFMQWAAKYHLTPTVNIQEIESAWNCQVDFIDESGRQQYIHSPVLTVFLQYLAQQYEGKFLWEKEGKSFSLMIPKQRTPSSTI